MVSIRYFGLAFVMATAPVYAEEPLNYEDYQRAIGAGQERLDYSKRLIGHDKLHTLVPEASEPGSPDTRVPLPPGSGGDAEGSGKTLAPPSEKEGEGRDEAPPKSPSDPEANPEPLPKPSAPESDVAAKPKAQPKPVKRERSTSTHYISPSLRGANGRGQRNEARVTRSNSNRVMFGISLGTKITVTLDNSASNVQPGFIALRVGETIRGRKNDLPHGSTLFARSSAVIGSERLFLNVTKGVTPDGDEFNVQGVVFDNKREPGLAARVISDGKTLARASSEGLNTLGRELLSAAPTNGATGAATEATLSQLLKEKAAGDQAAQGRPAYVVVASPQTATVQIESTF